MEIGAETVRSPRGGATIGSHDDAPWVLVRAARNLFAIHSAHVQEMVPTPSVSLVPDAPAHVRGMVSLRGRVMPLVDLRTRIGLASHAHATSELVELLAAREQDHRRWVEELVASVDEKRPFTLTTDPHACRFGKWYDTFKTDHLLLETVLKRFDEPHKRIHAIGAEVVSLVARGDHARCVELVNEAKHTTLESLIHLFAEAQSVLTQTSREISVVVTGAGPIFALAVDGIVAVERLTADAHRSAVETLGGLRPECVETIVRRGREGGLVLTLAADSLLGAAA